MDNIKNDNYYIQKIQQDLKFIVRHMKNRIVYDTKCCVITNVSGHQYTGFRPL